MISIGAFLVLGTFDVDHVMFSEKDSAGQKNLRQVLQAYALFNPELGYCQGMGMIVGLLLMRMNPEVRINLE